MTIVAAASWDGEAWIGCDSAATDDDGLRYACGTKLAEFPFGWAGFSGSYRVWQVVQRGLRKIEALEEDGQRAYLADELEEALEKHGHWGKSSDAGLPSCEGLELLLLSRHGRILIVQDDLGILEAQKFACIGRAEAVGSGALFAGMHLDQPAEDVVRAALRAACTISDGCAEPLYVHGWRYAALDPLFVGALP